MIKDMLHPRNSSVVVQHNELLQKLVSTYNSSKLHHAYILYGIKGIGKSTLTYVFIKLLLSSNNKISCNSVVNSNDVNLINSNSHPNLLVIEPEFDEKLEQYKNTITIDQIRKIKPFLSVTSLTSDTYPKIVIIDSLDNLNINAANSMLKLLEEPSSNRFFFLICHNLSSILPTIKSRCTVIKCNPLSRENVYKVTELLNIDRHTLQEIKKLNIELNSMQDILWFLDSNNYKIYKYIQEIILNKNISKINLLLDSIKNLNSYNFKYLVELITPKNFNHLYKHKYLDSEFLNIKLLLEQDKLFTLDKSTILLTYILKLIS